MKRHSTDLVSLAFGLIFAGIAGWWLLGRYLANLHVNIPNLGLFLAGALIVLGLLGVFGSLRRERRPAPLPAPAPVAVATPLVTDDGPPYRDTDTDTAVADTDTGRDTDTRTDTDTDTAALVDPVPPSEEDTHRN